LPLRKDRLGIKFVKDYYSIRLLSILLFILEHVSKYPVRLSRQLSEHFFYCESYFAESSKISSATKSPIARV